MITPSPKIPRIIHQTWKSEELPEEFHRFSRSWMDLHPEWAYRFYSDADCRAYVEREFPGWLSLFDGFPRQIQRIDLFRYLVVFREGGLYADMDMECKKPIDPLLAGKECVFSIEAHLTRRFQAERGYAEPYQIANCVFATAPGHPFLERVLGRIRSLGGQTIDSDEGVEETTGPIMLTRLYYDVEENIRNTVTLLPQINLLPPREYPDIYPVNANVYARHHFSGTWKTGGGRPTLGRRLVERNRLPPFA